MENYRAGEGPPGLTGAGQGAHVVGVDQVGDGPAIEVVFVHALLGEALVAVGLAAARGGEQDLHADVLAVAAVVALVELVAAAELGPDGVPEELHELDALDRLDAVGSADVSLQIFPYVGVLEVA